MGNSRADGGGGGGELAGYNASMVQPSLDSFLSLLCARLPALVGLGVQNCDFCVAVVTETSLSSLNTEEGSGGNVGMGLSTQSVTCHTQMKWYFASETEPLALPLRLSKGARSIADNLARSCVAQRSNSVVDISGDSRDSRDSRDNETSQDQTHQTQRRGGEGEGEREKTDEVEGLRVLCHPLEVVSRGGSVAVGVLQMTVRRSCLSSQGEKGSGSPRTDTHTETEEMRRLHEFLTYVSGTVACAVFSAQQVSQMSARSVHLEEDLHHTRTRSGELERHLDMWQKRSDAWCGVATAAAVIARHGASGSIPLPEVVASEAVAGPLRATGVHLAVRYGPTSSASEGENDDRDRVIADIVSLHMEEEPATSSIEEETRVLSQEGAGAGERSISGPPTAEVSCGHGPGNALAPIAADLVHALSAVLKSTATHQKSRYLEGKELRKAHSKAREQASSLQNQLQRKEQELADESTRHAARERRANKRVEESEQMSAITAASMSSFCGPTIREISVMLEELSTEKRPQLFNTKPGVGASSETPGQMDWAWEGIARVADRAMGRISENRFGYHASILVRVYPRGGSKYVNMDYVLCLKDYSSFLLSLYSISSGDLGSPDLLLLILYNSISIAQHHHTN